MTMEQSKEILEKMAAFLRFFNELLQVVPQGALRMATAVDGQPAMGVAGNKDDLGTIFRFELD